MIVFVGTFFINFVYDSIKSVNILSKTISVIFFQVALSLLMFLHLEHL